jgi:hypothetical protein
MKINKMLICFIVAVPLFATAQEPAQEPVTGPYDIGVEQDDSVNQNKVYKLYNFVKNQKESVVVDAMTASELEAFVPQVEEIIKEYWRMIKEDRETPQMAVYKATEIILNAIRKQQEIDKKNADQDSSESI